MPSTVARVLLLSLLWSLPCAQADASAAPEAATPARGSASFTVRVSDQAAAESACGTTPQAQQLAELIRRHPLQSRFRLSCHPVLAQVAALKAEEMAARGRVTHIYGVMAPNRRLRHAGYALPHSYPSAFHNQVEAVSGGYATAEAALKAFLESPAHRTHLLAEHPFYAEQDEIAVGYARNPQSEHVDFWVVYIARRADSGNPPVMLQAEASPPSKSKPH